MNDVPKYDKEKADLYWQLTRIETLLLPYKELEDKLGIDLIKVFQAIEQDIIFIKTDLGIKETLKNGEGWGMKVLQYENNEFNIFCQIMYPNDISHKDWITPLRLKLNDYGKSWALTKEELL